MNFFASEQGTMKAKRRLNELVAKEAATLSMAAASSSIRMLLNLNDSRMAFLSKIFAAFRPAVAGYGTFSSFLARFGYDNDLSHQKGTI